jgi:hypothetical protein
MDVKQSVLKGQDFSKSLFAMVIQCPAANVTPIVWHFTAGNV